MNSFRLAGILSAFAIAVIFAGGAGVLAATGIAWYLFSGHWNIAASEPHFPPVRWAAEQVYRASVDHHADPISLDALAEADVAAGAQLYAKNCARCHSAPGGELTAWAEGMRPMPPALAEEGTDFAAAEVFWLLQHGIKMSGMPAWGHVLSDQELLTVTAFVKEMPDVSPDRYAQMLQEDEESADETAAEDEEMVAEAGGRSKETEEAGDDAEEARPEEEAEPAAVVEMTNALTYEPATITVKVGETVRWTNPSDVRHTVTADKTKANDPSNVVLPEGAEPFNSGNIEAGGSWSYTFEVAGRYKYFCIPHEAAGMVAEVIVEE